MSEHDENPAWYHGPTLEELLAMPGNNLPRSMDPYYSTGTREHPGIHANTGKRRPRTIVQASDFAWVQEFRDEEAALFQSKLLGRLDLVPSGQRIRVLRAVLGWAQRQAATQLGISVRTLIRYERGHHRPFWPRLSLLERLRELESEHAQELIAYLTRGGPEHA